VEYSYHLKQEQDSGYVEQFGENADFCSSPLFLPGFALLAPVVSSVLLVGLLVFLFVGVNVLVEKLLDAVAEITGVTAEVFIKEKGEGKVLRLEEPVWREGIAYVTLLAVAAAAPEIFLCFYSTFKDRHPGSQLKSSAIGPLTLIGSAAFNLLIVGAISMVATAKPQKVKNYY